MILRLLRWALQPDPEPEPDSAVPDPENLHPRECSFSKWGEPFIGSEYPHKYYYWQMRTCLYCEKAEVRVCSNDDLYEIAHGKKPDTFPKAG